MSLKRVVSHGFYLAVVRKGVTDGMPSPPWVHEQLSDPPHYGGLGETQLKGCSARPWFTDSLVITQVQYILGLKTGFSPTNMDIMLHLESEKSYLEKQTPGEEKYKIPWWVRRRVFITEIPKIFTFPI